MTLISNDSRALRRIDRVSSDADSENDRSQQQAGGAKDPNPSTRTKLLAHGEPNYWTEDEAERISHVSTNYLAVSANCVAIG